MRKLIYIYLLLGLTNLTYSQSTPYNDPNAWILNWHEDFNYTSQLDFITKNPSELAPPPNDNPIAGQKWTSYDYRQDRCPYDASISYTAGCQSSPYNQAPGFRPNSVDYCAKRYVANSMEGSSPTSNYIFNPGPNSTLPLSDDGYVSLVVKNSTANPVPRDIGTVSSSAPYGTGVICTDANGVGSLCNCTRQFTVTAPAMLKTDQVARWKYGYFEIRCRLPVTSTTNGKTNMGIGANFWMMAGGSTKPLPAPIHAHSEIDIFEFGNGTNDAYKNPYNTVPGMTLPGGGTNMNIESLSTTASFPYPNYPYGINDQLRSFNSAFQDQSTSARTNNIGFDLVNAPSNDGLFHTYALGWYPGGLEYYKDGILIDRKINHQDEMDPQFLIVDINVSTSAEEINLNNTVLPYSFDVDYVKVHKLAFDCPSLSYNPTAYNTPSYNSKVKYDVNLGGVGKTYILPSSSTTLIKASNSIIMSQGFEVNNVATFVAGTTPCQ